jgi:hypothetical protein
MVFTTMHPLRAYGAIQVEQSIFNSNFHNATGYLGFSSLPAEQLQPALATDYSAFGAAPDARCREYSLSGANSWYRSSFGISGFAGLP